jgi:hypothetical protein
MVKTHIRKNTAAMAEITKVTFIEILPLLVCHRITESVPTNTTGGPIETSCAIESAENKLIGPAPSGSNQP